MKVYLVFQSDYDWCSHDAVFSTKEKAQQYATERNRETHSTTMDDVEIKEFEVDERAL